MKVTVALLIITLEWGSGGITSSPFVFSPSTYNKLLMLWQRGALSGTGASFPLPQASVSR